MRLSPGFFLFIFLLVSCRQRERNCLDFREGVFAVETLQNGEVVRSEFRREGGYEYDYFEGKIDTSRVRWINDCECILQKLNPSSVIEGKPVHIRILHTTENSYTFDYGFLDDPRTLQGTAYKTDTLNHGDLHKP